MSRNRGGDKNIFCENIFCENIFDKNIFCENFFDGNIFGKNIFDENIFGENIFDENIFGENIFGNNIFFGKGLYFPSHALLSTPNIQLPPPLTSCLKLRGGTKQKNSRTGRTQ